MDGAGLWWGRGIIKVRVWGRGGGKGVMDGVGKLGNYGDWRRIRP